MMFDMIPDWGGHRDSAEGEPYGEIVQFDDAQLDAAWLIGAPSRPDYTTAFIIIGCAAALAAWLFAGLTS